MKEDGDKKDVSMSETGFGGVAGSTRAAEIVERMNM